MESLDVTTRNTVILFSSNYPIINISFFMPTGRKGDCMYLCVKASFKLQVTQNFVFFFFL